MVPEILLLQVLVAWPVSWTSAADGITHACHHRQHESAFATEAFKTHSRPPIPRALSDHDIKQRSLPALTAQVVVVE